MSRGLRSLDARAGAYLVEAALVAPFIIALLMGVLETGLLFGHVAVVRNAAREGGRAAAVGETVAQIQVRVEAAAAPLRATPTVTSEYRTQAQGGWGSWEALTDIPVGAGYVNEAPPGSQVRITVTCPYELVAAGFLPDLGTDGTLVVRSAFVMRRE